MWFQHCRFQIVGLFFFTYFSHNYHNYSMFRDVPECSGMFHVPDFIDESLRRLFRFDYFILEICLSM